MLDRDHTRRGGRDEPFQFLRGSSSWVMRCSKNRRESGRALGVTVRVCSIPPRSRRRASGWSMRSGSSTPKSSSRLASRAPEASNKTSPRPIPACSAGPPGSSPRDQQRDALSRLFGQRRGQAHRLSAHAQVRALNTAVLEQAPDHPLQCLAREHERRRAQDPPPGHADSDGSPAHVDGETARKSRLDREPRARRSEPPRAAWSPPFTREPGHRHRARRAGSCQGD